MNALEKEVDGKIFLHKLIIVCERGELDFWQDRKNPPNLSPDEFDLVLHRIDRIESFTWVKRQSANGQHGKTGEDDCFKFSCMASFGGIYENLIKFYFVKGYFFDKQNLKGVTIQSFREVEKWK